MKIGFASLLLLLALPLTGCIGIYDNSERFMSQPGIGTDEVTMLKTYGTPDFVGFVEDKKVYTYKVRNNKYIILVGDYQGYDLVIVCESGQVKEVTRVNRPKGFALLNPVPWAEVE